MIRAFFRLFLCLMLAARVSSAQPLPDRAPVAGFALDVAGKPLAGVLITLRRQESSGSFTFWGAVTASDARGAWRFAQAEAGRYYLSAEAPGFAPISNQSLEWKVGAAPLRLQFQRLATLRLTMTGSNGAPLIHAPLWFRLRGDGEAGQITRRTITDAMGQAQLEGLLPATYALWVAAPGGYAIQNGLVLRGDKTLDLGLLRGGALLVRAAQNASAGNASADNASTSGDSNRPLGGAVLSLTPQNSAEAMRALGSSADLNENVALLAVGGDTLSLISRDGDGQIGIPDLPPGSYIALVRLPGYDVPALQEVTIANGQTTELGFVLAPTARNMASLTLSLPLRIEAEPALRDSSQNAAPGDAAPGEWSLRVLPIDQNGALAPEARDDSAFLPGGNAARRALRNLDSRVTLFPIPVGRYRVFVAPRPPRGHTVAGDSDGEPEIGSVDVDVPAQGATAAIVGAIAAPRNP